MTQDEPSQLSPILFSEKGGGQVSVDILSKSLLVIPHQDILYYFKDNSKWNSIQHGFRFASLDPTILLDILCIPNNNCNTKADVFSQENSSDCK